MVENLIESHTKPKPKNQNQKEENPQGGSIVQTIVNTVKLGANLPF